MDARVRKYYDEELSHVREMAAGFAASEHAPVADRLGWNGSSYVDPYVQQLLEGFAYLSARVRSRVDAEFPTFVENLLQVIYPRYLAPTPSTGIVQFQPHENLPPAGQSIATGSRLLVGGRSKNQPRCEFRTAHDVRLLPMKLTQAQYLGSPLALSDLGIRPLERAKAGIRLKFSTERGIPIAALLLDSLTLYIANHGPAHLQGRLCENLLGPNVLGFAVRDSSGQTVLECESECVKASGFDDAQALVPPEDRSPSAFRLLQEYFSLAQRFMFVAVSNLQPALQSIPGSEFEIVLMLASAPEMQQTTAANFKLFCTPASNVFERQLENVTLYPGRHEYPLEIDHSRSHELEIFDLVNVQGYGDGSQPLTEFRPFYGMGKTSSGPAFYCLRREPKHSELNSRPSYVANDASISLVDSNCAPRSSKLKYLRVKALCTNRNLAHRLRPTRDDPFELVLEDAGGVDVDLIEPFSHARPSPVYGSLQDPAPERTAWQLISHLSFNYLSLLDEPPHVRVAALQEMLRLHTNAPEDLQRIAAITDVTATQTTGRLPQPGRRSTHVRGIEVRLSCKNIVDRASMFLLGSVLNEFFRRYVSINSFTQLVLQVDDQEEIRWPAKIGQRRVL